VFKDPIVEEVHRARGEIFAECGYDLHKLLERCRDVLKDWPGKVVTKEELLRDRQARKKKDQEGQK
jgi:hypothetical protein